MKTFLRPSFVKILLAAILFVITSWLWRSMLPFFLSDTFLYGFPLSFYQVWGPCRPEDRAGTGKIVPDSTFGGSLLIRVCGIL